MLRIALATILAAAGIGGGAALGTAEPQQSGALPRVLTQLRHGADARSACATLEAATFLGGGDALPEAQVAELARDRFSRGADAERFARDVARLRQGERARAVAACR